MAQREREREWKIGEEEFYLEEISSSASLGYRVKTWKPAIGDDKKFSWPGPVRGGLVIGASASFYAPRTISFRRGSDEGNSRHVEDA